MVRQRSLQNGKSVSVFLTSFLQMGQRSSAVDWRGIALIVEGIEAAGSKTGLC